MAITTTITSPSKTSASTPSPFPNWADKPFPLLTTPLGQTPLAKAHGALTMAQGMAHLHNIILRAMNSTYQQAPYVKEAKDIQDLIQFVTIWHDFLEHHHETEEIAFFPALEKLTGGSMENNIAQHRAFEAGLAAIQQWTKNTTSKNYDAAHLRALLLDLGPVLQTHLSDEIETLLALRSFDDSDALKKVWTAAGDYAKAHGEVTVQVPFIVGSYDQTYEGGAVSDLQFPWVLTLLNSWVFSRKHAGAWRFLPCDWSGKPRALAFVPK
jgi:hemerythrin-like domain-containing protein